jgi:hypothetical protein
MKQEEITASSANNLIKHPNWKTIIPNGFKLLYWNSENGALLELHPYSNKAWINHPTIQEKIRK